MQLIRLLRSSRSILNRLDEPDAMAPTAPPETTKDGLKHASLDNSAQRAFQTLSWADSESSLRALRHGAYGPF